MSIIKKTLGDLSYALDNLFFVTYISDYLLEENIVDTWSHTYDEIKAAILAHKDILVKWTDRGFDEDDNQFNILRETSNVQFDGSSIHMWFLDIRSNDGNFKMYELVKSKYRTEKNLYNIDGLIENVLLSYSAGSVANVSPKSNQLITINGYPSAINVLDEDFLDGGFYTLNFSTNSTPPTVTFVARILGLENFTANPNTFYSIKVTDNRAIVDSWQLD